MSKERLENREFVESIKEYSQYEHMREGFIVPQETYIRLVKMAEDFITIDSQYDTCIKIQEEMVETKQQNKRYREALGFYADVRNHRERRGNRVFGDVFYDEGKIARKALEESE